MENKIKKLIIGFFAIMIILTMISRIAASAMVAKVSTASAQEGELAYDVAGTGTVRENAKKYLDLLSGYKIGKVYIKKDEKVKKGDLLFIYDLNELKKKEALLENEKKKLLLQYQKSGLSVDDSTDIEEAVTNKINAKEDLSFAEKDLEDAKQSLMETKEEEYKKAASDWEDAKEGAKQAEKGADRTITDAQEELDKLQKPQLIVKEKILNYRSAVESQSEDLITSTYNDILNLYYDGAYKAHQKEIKTANEKVSRAEEDLQYIRNKWNAELSKYDLFSPDYMEQYTESQKEINDQNRTIADAKEDLADLQENDTKLDKAIQDYRNSIEDGGPLSPTEAYNALSQLFSDKDKIDEDVLNTASLKLSRAKEDKEQTISDWGKKVDKAFENKDQLQEDLMDMKDNTYDYKDSLKDTENAVVNAKRALKTAEINITKAEKNAQNSDKSIALELDSFQIDIDEKQSDINQIQKLIEDGGKILSPVGGVVAENDLEQGMTLAGQEKLIISTGSCELSMKAEKDDMKNFSKGDQVEIKTDSERDGITAAVEHIQKPDQDGNVSFTALLPKGNYEIGSTLDYELKKSSEKFPLCIPVEALRQDPNSAYILLARESDSVLGKIQTAFRLNVKVISQDAKTAAVDASITEDDAIIISSNKNISEGDRVRVAETK